MELLSHYGPSERRNTDWTTTETPCATKAALRSEFAAQWELGRRAKSKQEVTCYVPAIPLKVVLLAGTTWVLILQSDLDTRRGLGVPNSEK